MRIRTKLVLLSAAVSLAVTAVVGTFLAIRLRVDRRESIVEGVSRQLDGIERAVTGFLEEVASDLDALAANDLVRTRDDRTFTSFLDAEEATFRYRYGETERAIIRLFAGYRATHPHVGSVYMGRENGSFVRSHPRERPTRYDPRDRPWYVLAKKHPGEVVMTDAYPSLTTSDVNIGFEKALTDEAGVVYGVVGIDVTLLNLTEVLDDFITSPPGTLLVVDGRGTVLASQIRAWREDDVEALSPGLAGLLAGRSEGPADVRVRGLELLAVARPPTPQGWRFLALIPSRQVGAEIRPAMLATVAGLAAGWLVLGVLILAGIRLLVLRPLEAFAEASRHVALTTSLERRIEHRSRDEIGDLAQSYNAMIGALQANRQELQRTEGELRIHRDHLEEEVAERTVELQDANRRLKQEIAERIVIEQALAEREAQYRDLVESANSIIIRFLPDGRLTFVNAFAQEFFGWSSKDLLGRNLTGTLIPAADSTGGDLSSLIHDIVTRPESHVRHVNENIRANGERVWVAWSNKAVAGPDGQVAEVLSIGVDITPLVRTERELRTALEALEEAKQRAESADRLKSAFLATMSHELRTPLNSIIGFTGILLQGLVGPLNPEQEKQLGMVRSSAQHLLSLIGDVLDISKIEAGQMTVAREPVDAKAAMEMVVQAVRPLAEKKGLALDLEVGAGVATVVADARRTEQVLLNLLSNAVKFTERGRVAASCRAVPGGVEFEVSDTGIGIGDEDLARLFKPFQQVDTGLSRKYEGTGLGLSICKRLVELMGGTIDVRSEKGRGSTFSVRLQGEGSTP
jgi:PAS domain S-box-containing protein